MAKAGTKRSTDKSAAIVAAPVTAPAVAPAVDPLETVAQALLSAGDAGEAQESAKAQVVAHSLTRYTTLTGLANVSHTDALALVKGGNDTLRAVMLRTLDAAALVLWNSYKDDAKGKGTGAPGKDGSPRIVRAKDKRSAAVQRGDAPEIARVVRGFSRSYDYGSDAMTVVAALDPANATIRAAVLALVDDFNTFNVNATGEVTTARKLSATALVKAVKDLTKPPRVVTVGTVLRSTALALETLAEAGDALALDALAGVGALAVALGLVTDAAALVADDE